MQIDKNCFKQEKTYICIPKEALISTFKVNPVLLIQSQEYKRFFFFHSGFNLFESKAVDGNSFLESNASSILGTLT